MNANELADADDVIHKLQSWSEAYPTDIFPEISEQDIEYINAVNENLSARFFAHVGRHFIKKGFEPAITMLRQQQADIELLEKALEQIATGEITGESTNYKATVCVMRQIASDALTILRKAQEK